MSESVNNLRYATLCTGVEGFGQGFDQHGWKCVFQCEQDRHCQAVLQYRYPGVERTWDVYDEHTVEFLCRLRPELIAFGFPCQDLSVAGRRDGLAGKRSGLFFRCMEIVNRCRPLWLVIENVDGLLSSWTAVEPEAMQIRTDDCEGRTIEVEETSDFETLVTTVGQCGYWWAYRVFDAQFAGVAQRRNRFFLVGHSGDRTYPARVLFDAEGMSSDSAPSRESGTRVAASLTRGADSSGRGGYAGRRREDDVNLVASPLTAGYAKSAFNDGRKRGVDPLLVVHTLRAEGADASEDGTGRGTPLVVTDPVVALDSHAGHIIPIQECDGRQSKQQNDYGIGIGGDVMYSLQSAHQHGIYHSGCTAARRLTPLECERLMGYPDDWTRWGLDESANRIEISNSQRYRMCGNGVVTHESAWIAERIDEVRDA